MSSPFELIRQNVEVDLKKFEWNISKIRDIVNQ